MVLTSEAEGPGLVLGGERAALLMQSNGVGNCINTFSILQNCAAPLVLIVTMRGEFNDFNPWQRPMGKMTEETLKLCGIAGARPLADSRRPQRLCGFPISRCRASPIWPGTT